MNKVITNDELFVMVRKHMLGHAPFCVTRYGDGEYLVASESQHSWISYQKHLGYMPPVQDRKDISTMIKRSVLESDVVCVSMNKGEIWSDAHRYFREMAEGKIIGDADCHTKLLKSGKMFELLSEARKLFFISGHDLEDRFADRFKFDRIQKIIIPKQNKYFPGSAPQWPDFFNSTIEKLSEINLSGHFCLVGAGFIGKAYMPLIKSRGGVVMDIGSAFDLMSGYKTRGTGGILQENKEYML